MEPYGELREKSILLIDDDPIIREMLGLAFAGKRCRLRAVASAEEGLAALSQEPFDIVISDLQLPGISGLSFLKQVRATRRNVVTVLISGSADGRTVARAHELGVNALLHKPFSVESVFQTVVEQMAT